MVSQSVSWLETNYLKWRKTGKIRYWDTLQKKLVCKTSSLSAT